ncbi:MAG: efflux RND transporter periplasmic adaptor subunit [Planctomycetota bacterium]|nr:efflux RND transporter periplasmic adaptor subunit [Planctomycetota bacterium]MDW8373493.1 efflux RND transporter periplasmic adaptor subunit [Planctomycetota bacterium]
MLRRNLVGLFISVVLVGCGSGPPPTPEAGPPLTVEATSAALVAWRNQELVPGTVRAARTAVLQARVPAVIRAIHAQPGLAVERGTLLVELDAAEISAKRDQARALAGQAAADLARVQELFATQAATKAELDAAQARAEAARAAAAEAETMLGYTRIHAPFSGLVVRKLAEVGDLVAPGRPIFELEDPESLRLEVEVPETLAVQVALGRSLPLSVPAAGIDGEGVVAEVTPAADPLSRSVLIKLTLPRSPLLRSGQFGRAAIPLEAGERLVVPAAAVVQRGQLEAVFVVDGERARLRLIRSAGADGERVVVRAGLSAGERVILDPGALRDGQRIAVRAP